MSNITEERTPLDKHKRAGKVFTPPLASLRMKTRSWINETLPEMLWNILLIHGLGRDIALETFREALKKTAEFTLGKKRDEVEFDLTMSGIAKMSEKQQKELFDIFLKPNGATKALRPLLLYTDLPAYKAWKDAIKEEPDNKSDLNFLADAVYKCLWHQSQEATDCRWVTDMYEILSFGVEMPLETKGKILGYPNEGDQREVRPIIRAMEIFSFGMLPLSLKGRIWPDKFWNASLKLTDCGIHPTEPLVLEPKVEEVSKKLNDDFNWLANWYLETTNTTKIESKHETIFGLAFYAQRLVVESIFSHIETLTLGRLVLRTLVEIYINLKYLQKKDEVGLWDGFREYGNGQVKLALLKFDEIKSHPKFIDLDELAKLADEDRWQEFVPINVGHWAELDLRKISIEADSKEVYDKYYIWSSNFSHAQWAAVNQSVMQVCTNPLHRLHHVPQPAISPLKSVKDDLLILLDMIFNLVRTEYPKMKVGKSPTT